MTVGVESGAVAGSELGESGAEGSGELGLGGRDFRRLGLEDLVRRAVGDVVLD